MSHSSSSTDATPLIEKLRQAMPAVRETLKQDGGDVELVGVDNDLIVQVRLLGACQGCSSSVYTWTLLIESLLRRQVPEIRCVEAVV